MRYLIILLAALFFSACKNNKGASVEPEIEYYRPLHEAVQAFAQLDANLLEYSKNGDTTTVALLKAADDLLADNEQVTGVRDLDSSYIYITMASGLEVVYSLMASDADGNPLTRGAGPGDGGYELVRAGGDCTNDIENRKVLLYNAQFNTSSDAMAVLNEKKAAYGLDVTKLSGSQCTFDALSTFKDYGLVVINTHGVPNGFMLGGELAASVKDSFMTLESFAEELASNQDKRITDLILTDLTVNIIHQKKYNPLVPLHEQTLQDADKIKTYVPAKYIATLDLSNTIVFGNMCYSGWSSTSFVAVDDIGMLTAFEQANVLSYFGYQQKSGISRAVNDDFAQEMERHMYEGFYKGDDSTGNVHLSMGGIEQYDTAWAEIPNTSTKLWGQLYLRQFRAKDYCYQSDCPDNLTDERDMQEYATVCIGNQVWMAENLRYNAPGSLCYDNEAGNCTTYGRLYSYETAVGSLSTFSNSNPSGIQGICPAGWHIPSSREWDELIDSVGGADIAGKVLKSATSDWFSEGGGTNDYDFNVLPSGGGFESSETPLNFLNKGSRSSFLNTTINTTSPEESYYPGVTFIREKDFIEIHAKWSYPGTTSYAPCRCVKD